MCIIHIVVTRVFCAYMLTLCVYASQYVGRVHTHILCTFIDTHHTWLKSPNAIAGPSVRAGFIDPPVYGPSANMPTVYARPTASGAALSAMLRSRSTTVANVTSPKINVDMNSRINTCMYAASALQLSQPRWETFPKGREELLQC